MDQKWIDQHVADGRLQELSDAELTKALSALRPASAHSPSQQAAANFVIDSYKRELDQRDQKKQDRLHTRRHRQQIVLLLAALVIGLASLVLAAVPWLDR